MSGRFGDMGEAQASSRSLSAAAGLVLSVVGPSIEEDLAPPAADKRFSLVVRAEGLLLHESLSHLSIDDPTPVRLGRWLLGGELLGEAQWSLSPAVAVIAAFGPEMAFGETEVFVHQMKVGELAPLRFVIQAGLAARF